MDTYNQSKAGFELEKPVFSFINQKERGMGPRHATEVYSTLKFVQTISVRVYPARITIHCSTGVSHAYRIE